MTTKLKLVHIQYGYEGVVIGVSDNDKDVKKIIRNFMRIHYDNLKNNAQIFNYSKTRIMRTCVDEWKNIEISEINLNEYSNIITYTE